MRNVTIGVGCYAHVYNKRGRAIFSKPNVFYRDMDSVRWNYMHSGTSLTEAQIETIKTLLRSTYAFLSLRLEKVSINCIASALSNMEYEGQTEEIYIDSLVKELDEENDVEFVFYLEIGI